jgi:5-methylcytosine-specific restriction enzyme subunit McrC
MVRRGSDPVLIIDTKWKRLAARINDPKLGVAQSDVYQVMVYGRVHRCPRLMLLYPHHAELGGAEGVASRYRVCGDDAELVIATMGLGDRVSISERLRTLAVGAAIQPPRRTERIEAAVE